MAFQISVVRLMGVMILLTCRYCRFANEELQLGGEPGPRVRRRCGEPGRGSLALALDLALKYAADATSAIVKDKWKVDIPWQQH